MTISRYAIVTRRRGGHDPRLEPCSEYQMLEIQYVLSNS
jgi:hypothetical protein